MGSGRDGGKETTGGREDAVGPRNDRVLELMEARQQQMLGALNATTMDMLVHNDRVLELMEARQQQMLGALNATTTDMLVHNDRVLELMEARLQQMLGALNATTMDMLAQNDQVLEMMEARQQQVLGTLNATTTDMLARIEGLREEKREELATTAAVPGLEYPGTLVHNDTTPSLCSGNKILYGTVGSLAVVSDGAEYSDDLLCSWELNFPQESSVNLTWDYIHMESDGTCVYDWVKVLDTRDSQLVYGKKLCGSLNPSSLKLLNVTVHGTRRLLVSFHSDGYHQGRGFQMTYQAHSRPS
ncbi:Blastula protease 10 [Chionoecetes opilio]|uniref:Blastula protease 10 n=1 Tax=Chionoecetes opilio TaxID=41210 RepID=A0A8J4Z1D3_CHIOP|nr:Blastula protease 10 [Chionoecetes opilio]